MEDGAVPLSPPGDPRGVFIDAMLRQSTPLSIQWDLTWRCDHKCVHCYLTDRHQDELTLDEQIGILDQLAEAGTLALLVSGGDPFLRPDALDFIRAARARHFDVRINSHGNFIDDALADALAEVGVSRVALSVYSTEASEHEAVTRIPGSHAKTLDAARRLVARGLPVRFKTPLAVHNRRGWYGVRHLAAEIGATFETDAHIVPDDQSDFGLCGIGLPMTERIHATMLALASHSAEVHWPPRPVAGEDRRTCSAGALSGYISPDGRLYPCLNWRDPMGDLRVQSFRTLWWESVAAARQRRIRRASYRKDCDGCAFHEH